MLPVGERSAVERHEDCSFRDCCPTLYWLLCWIPVASVAALFSWVYYAYVVVFCCSIVLQDSPVTAVAFGIVFHLVLFMCLWSFVHTTLSSPFAMPLSYRLGASEQQALSRCPNEFARRGLLDVLAAQRRVLTVGTDGCVRVCEPCRLIKPDRCHHCSTCRKCILKMDHHCPWFNNCVHFGNYKFFLLTLFYAVALSVYGVATLGAYMAKVWPGTPTAPLSLHLAGIVGVATTLGLGGFLATHIAMMLSNETTLEDMRGPVFRNPEDSFDIGRYQNFVQVFGRRESLWAVPVFTSVGDGARFPTKMHPVPEEPLPTPVDAPTPSRNGCARMPRPVPADTTRKFNTAPP
ncbi:hypothetical protein HPB50_018927 [Hyalomma asiaticum]|uniref:Uncharacterized protein n=1 Tax=Hyalomma asiaticum TaxID=266040 RepID=A0ACB7S2Q1_HYAAI|nr:hypothetical protein HPB50_018927 [Hyalomma asiaticum]